MREAVQVAQELGDITFVGAVAVYLHTKKTRESQDLDFAIASPISSEDLLQKGYKKINRNGKEITTSPRNVKVDIYSKDVSDIPVQTIVNTAKMIPVNQKGKQLKVASVECLIVAKHRASRPSRPQDDQDLHHLAQEKYAEIDWSLLQSLTNSVIEFQNIQTVIKHLYEIP